MNPHDAPNPSDLSEGTLLARARTGDRAAFEALQIALELPVRRFIRRLIGMHDAEDDIAQDVFFALYMNLDRMEPPEKLRPFVFRVIRNRCYDELRRQGRFESVPYDEEPDESSEHAPVAETAIAPPDEATHWLLLHELVQRAIADLPELQRQTLLMYAEGGLSYAEIAEAMGVSIGTVKSRLFHAKRNLAARLPPDARAALAQEGVQT